MNQAQDVSKLFELIGRQQVALQGLQAKLLEATGELMRANSELDQLRAAARTESEIHAE